MILIDFQAILIANIMTSLYGDENFAITEAGIRYKVLNTLKNMNQLFKKEHGKMLISCDSSPYWRKDIFPYYKAKREELKQASEVDWTELYAILNKIKKELVGFFPSPVIEVEGAESDDIIGVIARLLEERKEKTIIISRDKDFFQLHSEYVKQYDPIAKGRFLTVEDPKKDLFEHICKGDTGDSIPNILSAENCIMISERQKPMTQKKMDLWFIEGVPVEHKQRFEMNRKLIDLSYTPEKLKEKIKETFSKQINKGTAGLMKYLISNNLATLLDEIPHFI